MGYLIGEREFFLANLVIGQWQQLSELSVNTETFIKNDTVETDNIVKNILKHIPVARFIAIILNEKGKLLKDKDIDELEDYLMWNIEPDLAGGIITDFLDLKSLDKIGQKFLAGAINIATIAKAV